MCLLQISLSSAGAIAKGWRRLRVPDRLHTPITLDSHRALRFRPALQAARAELNDALKLRAKSAIGRRLRLPELLVSAPKSYLLHGVAAGLQGRSLKNLKWTEVGFDRDRSEERRVGK